MTFTEWIAWNTRNAAARDAYATRPATVWCAWSVLCINEATAGGFCPAHKSHLRKLEKRQEANA